MDYQDPCERFVLLSTREESANPMQWDLCKIVLKLPIEFVVNRFANLIESKKLGFIYIAAPLGLEEDRVEEIVKMLPPKVSLKFDDLQTYIRGSKPALVNSTVDFSLAEIDLAFRATYFLGSERSEWARMVAIDRRANNRNNDISLVNYLVNSKEVKLEILQAKLDTDPDHDNDSDQEAL